MYIVMDKAACMPASCWGSYRRVAVVEIDEDFVGVPRMISERAKGVRRIVRTWEKLHAGRTSRSVYQQALAEANALAAELNKSNIQ